MYLIFFIIQRFLIIFCIKYLINYYMGIGDWGWGIGDWVLGIGANEGGTVGKA